MYSHVNDNNLSIERYAVGNLSSMSNGHEESSPSVPPSTIEGLTCGIPTRTTPTLTPTTLKNIEESFFEIGGIPPAPLHHQHQAGFAPPLVAFPKSEDARWNIEPSEGRNSKMEDGRWSMNPSEGRNSKMEDGRWNLDPSEGQNSKMEDGRWSMDPSEGRSTKVEDAHWMDDCMNSSDRSMDSPCPPSEASVGSSRPARTGRSGGRRPMKDEKLSPEEEERRRIRRERNKLAAARCRKRRMELTSNLMNETDGLEEKRQNLQNEIQILNCQKEELEFILEAHKATCKLQSNRHLHQPKNKPLEESKSVNRLKSYSRPTTLPLSSNFNQDGAGNNHHNKSSPDLIGQNTSLNTPSTGLFQFDSLMDGGGNSATAGFVISSCGGQQRSSSSDLSSPDSMTPGKLVSL